MQFSAGRPDLVRAINQRWLLKFWKKSCGTSRIPQWQAVKAENLTRLSNALSFVDVVGSGRSARFQIRFYGETISKAYGALDFRGKFLDEIVPADRQHIALAPYHQTLESKQPVYTIHDLRDRNGRVIHFERLLLPFSHDGEGVDRILASLEFICDDGAFECENLLIAQKEPTALRLSIVIETHALV